METSPVASRNVETDLLVFFWRNWRIRRKDGVRASEEGGRSADGSGSGGLKFEKGLAGDGVLAGAEGRQENFERAGMDEALVSGYWTPLAAACRAPSGSLALGGRDRITENLLWCGPT